MTGPVILLPPGADLADAAARELVARRRERLPDLSDLTLLLPSLAAGSHLRRCLAQHAGRGLLGPHIQTLAGFAAERGGGEPPLPALECRLLLTEALRRYRNLFPGQDNARVAEALFELFEELSANAVDPGADEAAFAARLQQPYGAAPSAWLSREAQIVQRLWQAFGSDSGGRSPMATHLRRLRAALAVVPPGTPVILIGFDDFPRAEAALVAGALREGRAQLWLQGRRGGRDGTATARLVSLLGVEAQAQPAAATPRARLLDAAYGEPPAAPTDPGREDPGLRIVEAAGAEHEARCVDLAVRQALLAGARDVVVLAPDRRLARRLRALLDRAQVPLHDAVGWALSTSRAAAALDAWLECLDGDFRFRALLDFLKSGFLDADAGALDELERELIFGRGIDGGLRGLRTAARSAALRELLQRVQAAAFALPRPAEAWSAQRWMSALGRSLDQLGLLERLQADDAGARLAELLRRLQAVFTRVPLHLRWDEFRDLLDGAIERETFVPQSARGPVRLLTLEQSQNLRCDLLILTGATREGLPGAAAGAPFFNQSVRAELGLPAWPERQALALARLRRILESAPQVLVTHAAASEEEPPQLSPWIEAIEAQARGWGLSLRDAELPQRALEPACEVAEPAPTPPAPRRRPAPVAPAPLLPELLNATAHQALVDCPYKFFASSLLRLRTEHAPDEDPDRADYGELVHQILEAFVSQQEGLPPPFTEPVTAANREHAGQRLEAIAQAVLGPRIETRALTLTWLAEFRAAIPLLLDWLAARPRLRALQAEVELRRELGELRLAGRADRLETRLDGRQVVVDYKTGKAPKEAEVHAGEAVQLLHYALLDPQIAVVEYRPLRAGARPVTLEQDLPELRDAAAARLQEAWRRLRAGAPLPALGDEPACEHCDYAGLCRREDWHG